MTLVETPVDRLDALEAKLDGLTEQVALLTAELRMRDRQREGLQDLTADLSRVSEDALVMLAERLADLERKGYFEFARAAGGVADRVVANYDEDDLDQLGDNIVTILETIREITQPEMLTLLGRMVDAVEAERRIVEHETGDPPGLLALARQLRDPDVRRGMSRALQTLRAVSMETGPHPTAPHESTPT